MSTVLTIIRSKQGKIVYRFLKGAALGRPAAAICIREIAECYAQIDSNQIVGGACKRALLCLSPIAAIPTLALAGEVFESSITQSVCKFTANGFGLFFSGPAYGVDSLTGYVETLVFGEPVPIVTDKRLFLFGNPLNDI